MTLKPLRMGTQRQIQSCACAAQILSPHRDIPLLRAERCGATVGSQETEYNEEGGGSIGNVFPVSSGSSIALKCKKIICDFFDMKWQPVALRCCWLWLPAPTILPWRGMNVRCFLLKAAFSPNRGYSSQRLKGISCGCFYLMPSCHWQRFSLFDGPTCVRGPEKEHVWRLLA